MNPTAFSLQEHRHGVVAVRCSWPPSGWSWPPSRSRCPASTWTPSIRTTWWSACSTGTRNRSPPSCSTATISSDRAPVLISYYHGSQQVWLGLPFFALFGTTVAGLRLTHAMFALAMLAALYALLVRGGSGRGRRRSPARHWPSTRRFPTRFARRATSRWRRRRGCSLSLYALQRAAASRTRRPRRWLVASGVVLRARDRRLFHLRVLLPAMLLAAWLWNRDDCADRPARRLGAWVAAMVAVRTRCWRDLLSHRLRLEHPERGRLRAGLGAVPANAAGAWARSAHRSRWAIASRTWRTMLGAVVSNWFHHHAHLRRIRATAGFGAEDVAADFRARSHCGCTPSRADRASALLRILIALPLSFAAVAMIFGTRLQGHHFVPLLPLAYAALAVALCRIRPRGIPPGRWATGGAALVFAGLAALNIRGPASSRRGASRKRAASVYISDAINRLARRSERDGSQAVRLLSDWGLSMPVDVSDRRHGRHGLRRERRRRRAGCCATAATSRSP